MAVVSLFSRSSVEAGAGILGQQVDLVVAAEERLGVEVVGAALAAHRHLVVLVAAAPERSPRAVGPQRQRSPPADGRDGSRSGRRPPRSAGGRRSPARSTGRPGRVRRATPGAVGRSSSSSASAVEQLVHRGERLGRGGGLHVALVRQVDVGGAGDRSGLVPLRPDGQGRDAGGRTGGRRTIEVGVVGDTSRPLGRAVEVALGHRRAQRVADEIDLVDVVLRSKGVDRRVELVPHALARDRREQRVVLLHADGVDGIAVAGEAHRLALELSTGSDEAVHEHDRSEPSASAASGAPRPHLPRWRASPRA